MRFNWQIVGLVISTKVLGEKMKNTIAVLLLSLATLLTTAACSSPADNKVITPFEVGSDIEAFWLEYANANGGITWGRSAEYPEYEKVQEGDTFMVEVAQGPCLMEFFHNRWRRANDVRRWHQSINEFGGCPYVFD